jgi:tyrosyl-tRNA synthetase
MLTREETRKNADNYLAQFGKILDIDKVEIRYNSEWMDKINFNMV